MKPFAYTRVMTNQTAVQSVVRDPTAKFIAGGTNLIDLMKEDVDQPGHLVDINRLDLSRIEQRDDGLRLGALGRNQRYRQPSPCARDEGTKFSMSAFTAHFVEVRIDSELGIVRVSRLVTGCAAGRIINEHTARTQITGAVVGGLGMALTEETLMDHRMGRIVNASLAQYHGPVNADIPKIEAFFVEERDYKVNPLGAKGIGEVGYVGVAVSGCQCCFSCHRNAGPEVANHFG
jgi:xanthine dehydrogenase YagR molybdenum-binding subunit